MAVLNIDLKFDGGKRKKQHGWPLLGQANSECGGLVLEMMRDAQSGFGGFVI